MNLYTFTTQSGSTFTLTPAGEHIGWLCHYVKESTGELVIFTCDDFTTVTQYPHIGKVQFFGQRIVKADANGQVPVMTSVITHREKREFLTPANTIRA